MTFFKAFFLRKKGFFNGGHFEEPGLRLDEDRLLFYVFTPEAAIKKNL
jgi:hypothetical protein